MAAPRLSVKLRLTVWFSLTLLVLMSLFALFAFASFQRSLHDDFDRHLVHERRELMPFLLIEDGVPAFSGLDAIRSVAIQTDGHHGTYVRLLDAGGEVLWRSPNLRANPALDVVLPSEPREQRVSRDWDGRPVRTLTTPVVTEEALVGWLEVSGITMSMHHELRSLLRALVVGILLSVLLALLAGYLLARRSLRPVAAMTEAANRIHASDLRARLPTDFGVRDELSDLSETFNAMIERIHQSVERERRFAADAAHELMTPLATMRSSAEIALRRSRDEDRYREALAALLLEVERMTTSVRGLLELAQVDRVGEGVVTRVDLSSLVHDVVKRMHSRAEEARVRVSVDAQSGVAAQGDPRRLEEAIANLLDNALKYTHAGGEVTVSVHSQASEACVEVADTGIGFDIGSEARLFDRLYRADDPRVQGQPGAGLGLAIVRAVAEAYDGRVSASSAGLGKGSRFELCLPVAGEAPPKDPD